MRLVDNILDDLETTCKDISDYMEKGIDEESFDPNAGKFSALCLRQTNLLQELTGAVLANNYGDYDIKESTARVDNLDATIVRLTADLKAYCGV